MVVDKHEVVEPEIQLARERKQITHLVVPVDPPPGEIGATQHHLRMTIDGFQSDLFRILADESQHDPPTGQAFESPLKRAECFTDGVVAAEIQVLPSDLADDTAPQGVVEVEDENLSRLPLQRAARSFDVSGGVLEHIGAKRNLAEVPSLRVRRERPLRRNPTL